jgi:glycosidase
MDFVPNHTSNKHEWFIKSERKELGYENFYIWHPGKEINGKIVPPNNWVFTHTLPQLSLFHSFFKYLKIIVILL